MIKSFSPASLLVTSSVRNFFRSICFCLSSSFFIPMNIDDLGIGGSVHNLGRGEMGVFRTSWSACSRQAGVRQQTAFLLHWPKLELANAQRVAVVYDVVDASLTAICQARLCPQVRCPPKDGVLADGSFHREASSLIGRLTFGRLRSSFL